MTPTRLSIIAPVFDEQASIEEFVRRVLAVADTIRDRYDSEVILVDDGSRDKSLEIMKSLALHEPRLRIIELRRNYGQTAALQAGLDAAGGEVVVTLDADTQHFPEEIPAFLAKLEEGYDIVCGWRHQRAEGALRRWPSRAANWLIRRIARLDIHDFGTTFRAYRAEIIKDLRLYGEFHRFIPALGKDLGAKITELPIRNIERPAGHSKYGLGRTVGVFLDLIVLFFFVRYIDRPMRAFGKLGLFVCGIGSLILTVLVVYAYTFGVPAVRERQGWFLIAIMLLVSSVQIFFVGILAELIIRIHYAQGDRRVYTVRNEHRADHPDA
jgi:glycosyltransferase involved in cell wall biosynthesis